MTTDSDPLALYAALAARLGLAPPRGARGAQLRAKLLARVRASALAHRAYRTVRSADGAWQPAAAGVSRRVLRSDAEVCVELLRLEAGTPLPWPQAARAQEILLLDGALAGAEGGATPDGLDRLAGAAGYVVRGRGDAAPALSAATAARLYVRHLLCEPAQLPALEAHWWALACAAPAWVNPARRRWHASGPGVEVLPLRGDAEVVSMLVRFAPGAAVADHAHALDEDCLVLQGEMFLGDILLRAGDYQLAPAGGTHFGETSDVGVLFFFHGALDPVLRGGPPKPG